MKNKKGFTLVEILVVIVLIAIILVITIPSIIAIRKSIKSRELETKKEILISAAETYAENNQSLFPKEGGIIQIPVRTLVYYGYVNADEVKNSCNESIGCVINPVDSESMNDEIITIKRVKSVTQAVWGKVDAHVVTFYANGATSIGGSASQISIGCDTFIGASCRIKVPSIQREGFSLLGFNKDSSVHVSELSVGSELIFNGTDADNAIETEYYAITEKDVTITFDPNGGTLNGNSTKTCNYYNQQTSCSIGNSDPEVNDRTGYTRKPGWYDSATEGDIVTTRNFADNKTLYAQWNSSLHYILVRRTENYMKSKENNIGTGYNATYEPITGGYRVSTGENNYGGISLPSGIFVAGRRYIITYTLQKYSGNLYKIGGHLGEAQQNAFKINGSDSSLEYSNSGKTSNVSNNNTIYNVYLDITYKGSAAVWIQPNRGRKDAVVADITNLDIYEVFGESEKQYGTNYTISELNTEVFGNRGIQNWYNNNALSTKLTTSTLFNSDTAYFDDINTEGTKAYIYGDVISKSNMTLYCILTVDKNYVKMSKVGATAYGLTTNDTPTYNSTTQLATTKGTFYGYVTDGTNVASCGISVVDKVVTGKYCTREPYYSDEYYRSFQIYECKNGEWVYWADTQDASYEAKGCLCVKSGNTCSDEGLRCRAGGCQFRSYMSCPDGMQDRLADNVLCYAYLPATATSCPYDYTNGPYNRYGCPSGANAIDGSSYCSR